MTINDFQQWVKDSDRATKWDLLTTLQILSHLIEEVGELAQAVNRIHDYRGEVQEKNRADMGREIIGVFWFLVKIANRFDVDIESEAEDLVRRADSWPADQYQNHLINGLKTLDEEIARAKKELDLGR